MEGNRSGKREIKESLQRDSVLLGYRLQEEFSLEREELRAELRAKLRTELRATKGRLRGERGRCWARFWWWDVGCLRDV